MSATSTFECRTWLPTWRSGGRHSGGNATVLPRPRNVMTIRHEANRDRVIGRRPSRLCAPACVRSVGQWAGCSFTPPAPPQPAFEKVGMNR